VWGLFCNNFEVNAQTISGAQTLPGRFEDRLESLDSDEEVAALLDQYDYLHTHKINLRSSSTVELERIPELTSTERQTIQDLVEESSQLDWNVFQKNLDDDVLEIMHYCTRLSHKANYSGSGRWRLKSSTLKDFQMYGKFVVGNERHFFGSVVVERDPGEASLADHFAGGIEIEDWMGMSQFIVGQFRVRFGEGLSFGRTMGIAKSSNAIGNIHRSGSGLRVNTSSLENTGFTGIAGRKHYKHHELVGYVARSPRDGQFEGSAVQLSAAGLHTTAGMRNRQNNLVENLYGGSYQYHWGQSQIGAQAASLMYHNWSKTKSTPTQSFGSVWIQTPGIVHETGMDHFGHWAHFSSLELNFSDIAFVLAYRRYDPGYSAPFSRGFGEWTTTSNETGLYFGIRWIVGALRIESYVDQFHELEATDYPPRDGTEWLLQTQWRPKQRMKFLGRIKLEQKEVKERIVINGIAQRLNTERRKLQYRLSWKYRWESGFAAKVKIDGTRVYLHQHIQNGIQTGYKIKFLATPQMELALDLVPYYVEASDASTYYFFMPAIGTMQLSRQTGQGVLMAVQLRQQISRDGRWTLFYLQDRSVSNKISAQMTLQIDVAF